MTQSKTNSQRRFACKLLFCFNKPGSGKKKLCEERIFHIQAKTINAAYNKSLRKGKDEQLVLPMEGENWKYVFIGIIELVELASLNSGDEVWQRYFEKLRPEHLIPVKEKLAAFMADARFNKQ